MKHHVRFKRDLRFKFQSSSADQKVRCIHRRIIGSKITAVALMLSIAGITQAQTQPAKPKDVVAIGGGIETTEYLTDGTSDGKIHVSWDNADPNGVDAYQLLFSDGKKFVVCDTGSWARPGWLECDRTVNFNNGADRISYTYNRSGISSVQVNAIKFSNDGDDSAYSGYSTQTQVSDGVPRNLEIQRTGSNKLQASWDPNPNTLNEPVKNYEIRTRPNTWVQNIGKAFRTDNTGGTITLVDDHADRKNEARIRVDYEHLGISVFSDWIDEIPATGDNNNGGPVGPVAASGDLTDQCRDDNDPGTTNVFDRINGHQRGEYPEDRIPLETHVWFFPTDESIGGRSGPSFGHAHLLTCVPHTVLGSKSVIKSPNLRLDFEIQAHLHPAKRLDGSDLPPANNIQVRIDEIEIRARNGIGKDILLDRDSFPEFLCNPNEECIYQQTMDVELSNSDDAVGFEYNGIKELRIAALHDIYHNGEFIAKKRAILRNPVELNIPGYTLPPPDDERHGFTTTITESSGWLIEDQTPGVGGYATIGIHKVNGVKGKVPVDPISRNDGLEFTLRVEADPCEANCDVRNAPLTRLWAFTNPNFHAHSMDGHGMNGDTVCANDNTSCQAFVVELDEDDQFSFVTRNIDTSHLEPGIHQIMFAVEQPMIDGDKLSEKITDQRFQSTLTGILILRVMVN